jgi:hypothetical protein
VVRAAGGARSEGGRHVFGLTAKVLAEVRQQSLYRLFKSEIRSTKSETKSKHKA